MNSNFYNPIKSFSIYIGTNLSYSYSSHFLDLWKELVPDKIQIARNKIVSTIYQYYLRKINNLIQYSDYYYDIQQLIYSFFDFDYNKYKSLSPI